MTTQQDRWARAIGQWARTAADLLDRSHRADLAEVCRSAGRRIDDDVLRVLVAGDFKQGKSTRAALDLQVVADGPTAARMAESWVPQLSAKRFGLEWAGITWEYTDILAEHRALQRRDAAVLVHGGGSFDFRLQDEPMSGWYITLVDAPYATADGALGWCRAEGIDRDNCAAKFLTTRLDIEDTLELR